MPDSEYNNIDSELAKALPHLTPQQIAQVSPHFQRISYPAGEIIIHQGDQADRFYIIVKGRVEVWYKAPDQHDYQVAFAEVGAYFGETGLIKNAPRNSTVRATEEGEVELLALDREHFLAMIGDSRATEAEIAAEMTRRLINLSQYN